LTNIEDTGGLATRRLQRSIVLLCARTPSGVETPLCPSAYVFITGGGP
jgi:hypothetical protein